MSAVVAMPKLRTVRLYGRLGATFGREFQLAVNSPAEAVRALCSQIKSFEAYLMQSRDRGMGYAVFVGRRNLGEDELTIPPGAEDIRIAPVLLGAKKQGLFQIILGVALITAAAIATGGGALAWGAALQAGGLTGAVAGMGLSMAIGGVAQMLAPSPKGGPLDRPEDRPSYAFNGPVNTQAQGNPVPLLYGRMIIGSAVISAGIEAKDEVYVPDRSLPGGGGGGSSGGYAGGGSPPWHLEWEGNLEDIGV